MRGTFLDLPGEIRNQIYGYVVYPGLSCVTMAFCTKPEHLAAGALHLPLLRTCRQIRAATLSYLCATRSLKFVGIKTAAGFLALAGSAAAEIRSLVLVEPVLVALDSEENRVDRECFFGALETMEELVEIQVEALGRRSVLGGSGGDIEFVKRLEQYRERGVAVQVKLSRRA